MKDFYDIYHLLTTRDIDLNTLQKAVRTTFKNRDTTLSWQHTIFSNAFANDPARTEMWAAFLNKIRNDDHQSFQEVMIVITERTQAAFK